MTAVGLLPAPYADVGIALGLGLLLGLQRERKWQGKAGPGIGGARTFPVVALLGALTAVASGPDTPWLSVAGFAAVAGLTLVGYLRTTQSAPSAIGLTTEALLLLAYVLGVLAVRGHRELAVVAGAAALVLSGLKERLHRFAGRLTDQDETAALKFAAVALLVVPMLPDERFGPWDAVNPVVLGRMVVLVAGVSFVGYVAVKAVGAGRGLLLTGLLGGLASSTATTASFARRSRENPQLSPALAAGTLAACTVLYPRVALLVAVAGPGLLPALAPALLAMGISTAVFAVLGLVAMRRQPAPDLALANPFTLRPAILFALVYAAVVVAAKGAEQWFGHAGLYVAGGVAGVTDMDAISLTAARLTGGETPTGVLARTVAIAAMANALGKGVIAAAAGARPYALRVAVGLGASLVVGLAAVLLAP